jgi:hypothetical protein
VNTVARGQGREKKVCVEDISYVGVVGFEKRYHE